tara:strand:- start:262 stop:729 length:468 start_codon:yes stop_codon:yes gene_type:complete
MAYKKTRKTNKVPLLSEFLFFGSFAFLDQWCKFFIRTYTDFTYYIIEPWIGWEYLGNEGVAFGLPVPNKVLIVITPIILFFLSYFFLQQKKPSKKFCIGYILILGGALSNFIDRILFGLTIDYFRFITSVFNIADMMIVAGAILLILEEYHNKKK